VNQTAVPIRTTDLGTFAADVRQWLAEHRFELPGGLTERFQRLRVWQRELFDAGLMGLTWPEEYGGLGLTADYLKTFFDELAVAQLPPPAALVGVEVIGPTLVVLGTEEQRARFVKPLLSGEEIWCQGFSEPGAGSDLASLRTRAVREGDDFVISGQKVWTSWAQFSHWCAVLVRTDPDAPPHKGISCLLVDMSSPGVTVRPIVQMTGEPEFSELFFDDVRVPATNLLGELNNGWDVTLSILASERGSFALRVNAELGGMFNDVLGHLRRTTAADDVAAAAVGRAAIALQVLNAQAEKTVERLVAGVTASTIDSVDKLVITELEQRVHDNIRWLLGPYALEPSSAPFGLASAVWAPRYLYSRAATIYGGTQQIQRNIVAQRLLGLPRS
jgi:alkylation response protein AidB-like acyl-CoA dehydrogenase